MMKSGRLNKCMDCCKEQARAYGKKWRADRTQAQRLEKQRRDAKWRRTKARDGRLTREERAALAPLKLERQRARERQWQIDNPERAAELNRRGAMRRYARKKGAAGNATADQIAARWDMWGGKCWMCGDDAAQTDHVIPLNDGGSDWPSNQRPACASCNREKAALHLDLSEIVLLSEPRRRVLTESAVA